MQECQASPAKHYNNAVYPHRNLCSSGAKEDCSKMGLLCMPSRTLTLQAVLHPLLGSTENATKLKEKSSCFEDFVLQKTGKLCKYTRLSRQAGRLLLHRGKSSNCPGPPGKWQLLFTAIAVVFSELLVTVAVSSSAFPLACLKDNCNTTVLKGLKEAQKSFHIEREMCPGPAGIAA